MNRHSSKIAFKMAFKRKILVLALFSLCLLSVGRSEEGLENHCKEIFENCECTDYYIYCDNQGLIDITELQPYINTSTTSIILRGNDFKRLPTNLFHACTNELPHLTNLDLSDNNIETISGDSFRCLHKLEKLSLRNNSLRVDSFFKNFHLSSRVLKRLNLSFAFDNSDGSLDSKMLSDLFNKEGISSLERLDLSGNNIRGLYYDAGTAMCNLLSLKHLNLSYNNLSNPMIRECLSSLETLDLSHNQIDQLSPSLMDTLEGLIQLKEIRLDNNPYMCTCYIQDVVNWLNSTLTPIDKDSIICSQGDATVNDLPLLDLKHISALYCPEPRVVVCPGTPLYVAGSSMVYVLVAIGVLLTVFVIIAVLTILRRRWKYTQAEAVDATESKGYGPPYQRIV